MRCHHAICRCSVLLAAATFVAGLGAAPIRAQTSPEDPNFLHQFFLVGDGVVVRFAFTTDNATSIIERQNGACVQKINASTASIAVFDAATSELLAEGEGTFNEQATVNCATHAFDGRRIVITSAGDLTDVATGQPSKFHVRGILINGALKVFELILDPK